jgi:hypothetical protein
MHPITPLRNPFAGIDRTLGWPAEQQVTVHFILLSDDN